MGKQLAILGYHRIGPASAGQWETWYNVAENVFVDQLNKVRDLGWMFIHAGFLTSGLKDESALPERSVLVTFDDGFRSILEFASPRMKELDVPGVMFLPTQFVGQTNKWDSNTHEPQEPICTWDELRELDRRGISIQSHGVSHRGLSSLTPVEIDSELGDSKSTIEKEIGKSVKIFSFPFGDNLPDMDESRAVLHRHGYRAACLYSGGPMSVPIDEPFRLSRIAMGNETDLAKELST